ncbi:MAG TPA: hypothetical protein VE988_25635 [Gemmataceae bacterium]|nr:hypothetical protein [Gemmataceae bacterium]
MTADAELIRQCCQTAAEDLGIRVSAPFVLVEDGGKAHQFIALFPDFGGPHGTLILELDDYGTAPQLVAQNLGYGWSCLNTGSYGCYDRDVWIETLDDWGWSGSTEHRPSWCHG